MGSMTVKEVKLWQVWGDNDRRVKGRQLQVIVIHGNEATVKVIAHPKKERVGSCTKIRLDRFLKPRNSGYTLISEAVPAETPEAGVVPQEGTTPGVVVEPRKEATA